MNNTENAVQVVASQGGTSKGGFVEKSAIEVGLNEAYPYLWIRFPPLIPHFDAFF